MPQRLLLIIVFACCQPAWGSPPVVLATVKPIQLVAQAVTHEVTEVTTLLPTSVDPHTYALKPSDMRQLNAADLVIWAGPQFETYLAKPLDALADAQRIVTMSAAGRGLRGDEHPWLGARRALDLARRVAATLMELDPPNAARYQFNLASFEDALLDADARIRDSLRDLTDAPFLVYHDAFGSFEDEYGLRALGVIRPHEEFRVGARHLLALRAIVRDKAVRCVVVPPGPLPAEVSIISEGRPLRTAVLDPLAGDMNVGPTGYIEFLRQLAERMIECLQ